MPERLDSGNLTVEKLDSGKTAEKVDLRKVIEKLDSPGFCLLRSWI